MYIGLAVAAGIGLAFQAVINSRLRTLLDSALWAATVQVFVGLLLLTAVMALAERRGSTLHPVWKARSPTLWNRRSRSRT
jgi:uncharacterized membrane protein YdcZ (DUF606 family)